MCEFHAGNEAAECHDCAEEYCADMERIAALGIIARDDIFSLAEKGEDHVARTI